ncbi:nitroreductase/quinone reductase family protein [Nocardia alba]|uniref:Deazaflavin-dependent oxidoreductase (Nitroreductase family) n=1 Tax=Nocardia alba TaxID=225051 RepID=A0A4R1FFI4_9NOCA|nr:nitroreductase/quinone reductase family protein [Nocardia alba]TCJ93526.1 deazaflavin-dependent oxidoreductase (nitroreductase family) [Nocardia alba]
MSDPNKADPDTTRSLTARLVASSSQFLNKRGIYLGRRSTKLHVALYRRTGGRVGGRMPAWPDARILLLDHVGAKTGTRRTSPLMYHADGDILALAASKAGQPTHPAWFHNLKANPDTTIRIGAESYPVRARVATDTERNLLWPKFVELFPSYAFYQRNAGTRTIPIIILTPRT